MIKYKTDYFNTPCPIIYIILNEIIVKIKRREINNCQEVKEYIQNQNAQSTLQKENNTSMEESSISKKRNEIEIITSYQIQNKTKGFNIKKMFTNKQLGKKYNTTKIQKNKRIEKS